MFDRHYTITTKKYFTITVTIAVKYSITDLIIIPFNLNLKI